jgi:hypothetical protein
MRCKKQGLPPTPAEPLLAILSQWFVKTKKGDRDFLSPLATAFFEM